MEKEFNSVQEVITLFEGIPEEKWITGILADEDKRCAIGHINEFLHGSPYNRLDNTSFRKIERLGIDLSVLVGSNNGTFIQDLNGEMPGDTPKQRSINYLKTLPQ